LDFVYENHFIERKKRTDKFELHNKDCDCLTMKRFIPFCIENNQSECRKQENFECCKKIEKLEHLRQVVIEENIDCGQYRNDYDDLLDELTEYIAITKIRCSEHLGNNQPERSKRENSECFLKCKTAMCDWIKNEYCLSCEKNCKPEMRCSEHCEK
jgi:hypothetical protein